MITILAE